MPYEDLAAIIGALSEGLALRHQAAGTRPDERANLFGIALLAIIDSFVIDPEDPQPEDELDIAERVRKKFESLHLGRGRATGSHLAESPQGAEECPTPRRRSGLSGLPAGSSGPSPSSSGSARTMVRSISWAKGGLRIARLTPSRSRCSSAKKA